MLSVYDSRSPLAWYVLVQLLFLPSAPTDNLNQSLLYLDYMHACEIMYQFLSDFLWQEAGR